MPFTGKATYSAGAVLPETAEDVSDVIGIVSPYETPLLDALGDPLRATTSTHHEWLEDTLLPNKGAIEDLYVMGDGPFSSIIEVKHDGRFMVGDQVQGEGSRELVLVTAVMANTLTLVRGYAGTTPEEFAKGQTLNILGNAAMEGADKPKARFTKREKRGNYTRIFQANVQVHGTDVAASQLGLSDELDYQKQERLRELIRDLENTVINGREKMEGIISRLSTHSFKCGESGFTVGDSLDETKINYVLRKLWESSNGNVDMIVVGGFQKRKMNVFIDTQNTSPDTVYGSMANVYESDYGVCKVITTRWMPHDAALLLDSSRVSVLPLAGRSFHFKPLASTSDYECGELVGEYTLELKNEAAHGLITELNTG